MIIVIMGPCGCGKSTIARALSQQLGWAYLEADDYHPEKNRAKMARGIPLEDADRIPWLKALHGKIVTLDDAVVACSALKRIYRNILINGTSDGSTSNEFLFVLLQANASLLEERVRSRKGHFIPPSLIASQLETLEPPHPDESHLIVDASRSAPQITDEITFYVNSMYPNKLNH
ncbi:unnamed protein product [Calicophoron daubneyi]|uniref:Gluconokinase n=1 Tax=Calicophoron daubneyi TaxID=300641 RepID=A0AAV2T0X6_CALDB